MRLRNEELKNRKVWEDAGFVLPQFDREKMIANTKKNPEWIHFGAGNIFRAFQVAVAQKLLNEGVLETGIIVAEGYDYEIVEKSFQAYDDLSVLVTLKADGNLEKTVLASIAESLCVDTKNENDWNRLKEVFRSSSLKMVSFTITEKGYSLKNQAGEYYKDVAEDFTKATDEASSYIGKLVALCYERYNTGKLPITLVSMDNCSHNGTILKNTVTTFANEWAKTGMVDSGFVDYVTESISYPWSMIDKITPRPADSVIEMLKSVGFEDSELIITSKNTYTASFVNAEAPEYLVIEDNFKNGRLPLDKGGVIYTERDTVDKVEKMKVCTCLNPLHTALAIYGCLLSYDKISEEMKDKELVSLIKKIGYVEGLPVVVDPYIIKPEQFIDEVINIRLPNPYMPDTPQRIACDTSQKLGIRFGETMKAYDLDANLDATSLVYIPLVLAGWCRYLMGVNDSGETFELSPDPLLAEVVPFLKDIKLDSEFDSHSVLQPILSNVSIFGVDLYQIGLASKIEDYFYELTRKVGSVRETLKKFLDEQ